MILYKEKKFCVINSRCQRYKTFSAQITSPSAFWPTLHRWRRDDVEKKFCNVGRRTLCRRRPPGRRRPSRTCRRKTTSSRPSSGSSTKNVRNFFFKTFPFFSTKTLTYKTLWCGSPCDVLMGVMPCQGEQKGTAQSSICLDHPKSIHIPLDWCFSLSIFELLKYSCVQSQRLILQPTPFPKPWPFKLCDIVAMWFNILMDDHRQVMLSAEWHSAKWMSADGNQQNEVH